MAGHPIEFRDPKHDAMTTRRRLLRNAGFIFTGAAFSRPLRVMAQPVSSVMNTLSTYMSQADTRALPPAVIECAKQHILDTFAAMISGSELTPGRDGIEFARAYGGKKVATVVASDVVCGPIEAALVNGMLAHSDETDDSHSPSLSHPGCAVVPAALAAGEQFGTDGAHFLRAVVLGYDIGPRVTMALGGINFQSATHRSSHSIAGVFAAAAAAGCVARLSSRQMRWLLDYTAQQASGIAAWQRDTDHVEKAFVFAGKPARSGVTSALLVASGWTGVDDIFSGPDNFFLAYSQQADPRLLVEKLGERYEITRTNIKKWSVGSPIQAPLNALETIMARHPFRPDQVKQVIVRVATKEAAVVNNRNLPDICLQHMIALMLLDEKVTFRSAHDKERMKDPAVLRQRAKVRLVPDEQLESQLPRREAIVEVILVNGEHFTERVNAVRGSAQNPMTRAEVVAKARGLIAPVLGTSACERLIDRVLALQDLGNIRELRPLLQKG